MKLSNDSLVASKLDHILLYTMNAQHVTLLVWKFNIAAVIETET